MYKLKLLKNDLKVAVNPMPHMESVSIGVWIRAGGRYETPKNSGISHLLEHLLFKGTKKRDMKTIKEEIEGRGGSFNGFTSEEFTCYLVKLLAKDSGLGVDILSDMVLNPRIDAEEVAKEKKVVIEEINMYKDLPSHYVHELLAELMWPDQPLGMPLAGTVQTVESLTREMIVGYKDKIYNTKNMLLMAAGGVKEDTLVALSEKYLSAAKSKSASAFERVRLGQKEPCVKLYTKDTEQTHIALGMHSLDRFNDAKHALNIANILLGANMSSRLFHIVRDEMALCYEIGSSVRKYEDAGSFVISAGLDGKKLIKALSIVLKELDRIKKELVGKDELGRAKEYYKGQLLFALEDTMSHMLWLGEKIIAGEDDVNPKEIVKRIDAVTSGDVMKVAADTFKDDNLNLAVIGPIKEAKEIKEALHL